MFPVVFKCMLLVMEKETGFQVTIIYNKTRSKDVLEKK